MEQHQCYIKVKDKDNITLAKGELSIPKPLASMGNLEIMNLVLEKFAILVHPTKASIVKIYGIIPSVGDIVLEREMPWIDTRLPQITSGVKYDKGKPMPGAMVRIFPNALMEVGKCIEMGARKYPEVDNWQRVENARERYTDALMRHLIKHCRGEAKDEEDGLLHLSHLAWNALAILELYLREQQQQLEDKDNEKENS